MSKKNDETLITFGEEALTMRKDDPRTKEYKEKMLKKMEENNKMYEDARENPFKNVNLSNKRAEDETYDEYRQRLKLNNMLQKQYRKFGRDQFIEMYPAGVKYAIDQAKIEIEKNQGKNLKVGKAEYVDSDGNKQEIKLEKIMSENKFKKSSEPVTMEELNKLHDEWWASLTDEDKEKLYNEMVESEIQYYSDKTDQ